MEMFFFGIHFFVHYRDIMMQNTLVTGGGESRRKCHQNWVKCLKNAFLGYEFPKRYLCYTLKLINYWSVLVWRLRAGIRTRTLRRPRTRSCRRASCSGFSNIRLVLSLDMYLRPSPSPVEEREPVHVGGEVCSISPTPSPKFHNQHILSKKKFFNLFFS